MPHREYPECHFMPIEFAAFRLRTMQTADMLQATDILGRVIDYSQQRPVVFLANIANMHWNLLRVQHWPLKELQLFEPLGKPANRNAGKAGGGGSGGSGTNSYRNSGGVSMRYIPQHIIHWLDTCWPLANHYDNGPNQEAAFGGPPTVQPLPSPPPELAPSPFAAGAGGGGRRRGTAGALAGAGGGADADGGPSGGGAPTTGRGRRASSTGGRTAAASASSSPASLASPPARGGTKGGGGRRGGQQRKGRGAAAADSDDSDEDADGEEDEEDDGDYKPAASAAVSSSSSSSSAAAERADRKVPAMTWLRRSHSAITVQHQVTGFDCGVACLLYAEKCAQGMMREDINTTTSQGDLTAYRAALQDRLGELDVHN